MQNTSPDDEPEILRKHHEGSPGAQRYTAAQFVTNLKQSATGKGKSIVVLTHLKYNQPLVKAYKRLAVAQEVLTSRAQCEMRWLALNSVQNEWAGTWLVVQWLSLLCSQCRGPGFDPRSGTWLLCAAT